jgi:hypothetical protein
MTLSLISGRLDVVEQQMTYFTQDILQRPDISAYSQLSTNWNQQFDQMASLINSMNSQMAALQTAYTNLFITVRTNYALFTGHAYKWATGVNQGTHSGYYSP